jgi:hypothetical protein
MKDKYYTPELEEFHIGFEYEWRNSEEDSWKKENSPTRITVKDYKDQIHGLRVKYLDKEDIESTGFKHIGAGWFENKELDCRVRKWKELEIDIYKNWSEIDLAEQDELRCFRGNIKNKSEFKVILKQLNIK